ncbi:hypothetical protein J6590_001538 [Homalodisca vitripennis]|nr:hypothetical protein J6590_001538 [Homalodisca vitripennis]
MADDSTETEDSESIETSSSHSNQEKSSTSRLSQEFEHSSLPEIWIDHNSEGLRSIKSTEIICNDDECFIFKYIPDPGIHQAYVVGADYEFKEESGEELYLRLVKEAGIAPIKRIISSLKDSYLGLEHYGLDPRQMKPLTEALIRNTTIRELNLRCNELTVDGLYHLGLLICDIAGSLTKLNLQHCKIGPEGIVMLVSGLEICSLEELDLSHNEIGDSGMEELANKLCYNVSIRKLNLSHNGLTQLSGMWLADTMDENLALQHLDLSWNRISEEPGLKMFLTSATDSNETILSLNLSWNSLGGDKIANIIKNFIGQQRSIQELDLSHNRLGSILENTRIAKGISTSETLKTLDLSYNGHNADSALALLSNIQGSKLQTLLLSNVWVNAEFEKLQKSSRFRVVVEGVSGGSQIKGPDVKAMLLKRANFLGYKPKKNKKDFGWFLLRLKNADTLVPVKKAKFDLLIQEDKIKFDEGLIDELAKQFKNEEKKIDLNSMLEKYLEIFPDTVLPVPKEKRKRKASKDERKTKEITTDINEKISKVKEVKERETLKTTPELTEKNKETQKDTKVRETLKTTPEPTEKRKETKIDAKVRETLTVKPSAQKFPVSILVTTTSKDDKKSHKEVTFMDENDKEENKINVEIESDQTQEYLQPKELSGPEETISGISDTEQPAEEEISEEEIAEDIEGEENKLIRY